MPKLRLLDDHDISVLQEIIGAYRRSHSRGKLLFDDTDDRNPSPDVYIALPQDVGGIPGLVSSGVTGTGTDTTGDNAGDVPGVGTCDIYQIIDGALQSTGVTREVLNLSETPISQNWITVVRTKFGPWVAGGAGSGANNRTVFTIATVTDSAHGTGTLLARPAGCATVPGEVAGIINIVDVLGCLTLTVGLKGWASYMTDLSGNSFWGIDSLCCG